MTTQEILQGVHDWTNKKTVYDISVAHPDGQGNPTPYADLAAALGNGGANIPEGLRKGGMSVKFIQGTVQSSDNKYVQYKLVADSFSAKISDWQWVDNDAILANELSIKGDGDTLVWQDSPLKVFAGHKYRVYVTTPNVDMTGVTAGNIRFVLNTSKSTSESLVIVTVGTAFKAYYDITIPNGSGTLYWGGKAAENAVLSIHIEDITAVDELDYSSVNTITVAAYDSSDEAKRRADIVANSINSGISAINTAIQSVSNGGRVYLRKGTYGGDTYVNVNVENIILEGESLNTYINRSSGNPIICADDIKNTTIKNIKCSAPIAGTYQGDNVLVGNTRMYISRGYSVVIAAPDSSDKAKGFADIICTGEDDDNKINNALDSIPSTGGTVKLCAGTYTLRTLLNVTKSNTVLQGEFGATKIEYTDGFSGNWALLNQNHAENCAVIGINFGAKLISLTYSGSGYAYMCTYGSKYHTFSALERQIGLNDYTYLIAASDAPEKFKVLADKICDGTQDEVEIYESITDLKNSGKSGIILLSPGTFNLDSFIFMRGSGIELRGCGYATVINRVNPLALRVTENATNCVIRGINFGSHTIEPNYQGDAKVYDCWIQNDFYHEYINTDSLVYVNPSAGIAGINTAITKFGDNGGTIILNAGTYEGTTGIQFTGKNVIIEGQGVKTVIKRNSGNDIFCNVATARNNIIRNVTFYNQFQQTTGAYETQRYRIENCWNKGELINQSCMSNVIVNIGPSYYYKTIMTPYNKIGSNDWTYANRFEFHIHGHIVETSQVWLSKPVDFVGHNALVELKGNKGVNITFATGATPLAINNNLLGWLPVEIKDIHFIKTGCFNYGDESCANVLGNYYKFTNCIFENASSSPSPFDNSEQGVGAEDDNGRRRHGVVISIETFGRECKTEFHNCIAIGSPYGFQSTRGWYISYGSPKLFNCIGYGGGIGEFGHGFISHRASNAQLFNCIGYAGEHTYRQGAGFRFQAHGSNNLVNCVGYGSQGTQLKSEGVPEATILSICESVGITDTTFLYAGGSFSYANLTIKSTDDGYNASRLLLGNNIKNSDIVLTELGNTSEEGYGVSLWAHNGQPTLKDCVGYAGHGANSVGIKIEAKSKPNIVGGYFGREKQVFKQDIEKNSGSYCMFDVPSNILSQYTPYSIIGAGITISGSNYYDRHLLIHLETDETTPQVIIDGYDIYNISSIGYPTVNQVSIPAGVGLKAYITENGSVVSDIPDGYFYFMLTFAANPSGAKGGLITGDSLPNIKNAEFAHNSVGLGIYTTSTDYIVNKCMIESDGDAIATDKINLRVFDSAISGTVDPGITFASKTAVNGSSNYSI